MVIIVGSPASKLKESVFFCFFNVSMLIWIISLICNNWMQSVGLILFSTLTNTIFLCCRLLGEFILPPSNVLPRTYQDLHVVMKYVGMEYHVIHACTNDDILYYKEYTLKEKCQNVMRVDIKWIK